MKIRAVLIVILVAGLLIGAAIFLREPPAPRDRKSDAVVVPSATPRATLPPPPPPATQPLPVRPDLLLAAPLRAETKTGPFAIEDGKTIDFSTGMPLVKDSSKDQAIMDRAAKELEEAVRGVSFGSPSVPAPAAGTGGKK